MKRSPTHRKAVLLAGAATLLIAPALHGQADSISVRDVLLDAVATLTSQTTQDPVDEAAWVGTSLYRLLSQRDYATVLVMSALPGITTREGEGGLDGLGPLLPGGSTRGLDAGGLSDAAGCRSEPDAVRGLLCAAEALAPLAPSAIAQQLTEEAARFVGRTSPGGAPPTDLLPDLAEHALTAAWRLRSAAGAELSDPANDSPTLDDILAALVGTHPQRDGDDVLTGVPALRRLAAAYPLLSPAEVDRGTLDEVLGAYRSYLGGLTASLSSAVEPETAQGPTILDWASERAFVYLASRSASMAGAEAAVAGRVHVLGSAAVDLRYAASTFSASLASAGRDVALATLNGNVLGIASAVTAFFGAGGGGLGPDAAEEVRAVRSGIEDLGRQVQSGFDGVDARLEALDGTLATRFGRLEELVSVGNVAVERDLAALHDEVLALDARVERAETALQSYIQAGFDRDYSRTLVRCLEHRSRYLPPFDVMEFTVFSECLRDFRVRAAQDSRDALLTDQSTPLDDRSLAAALADSSMQNLGRRLPLLGRAAEQRFAFGGLRGGRGLANPIEWAVAAQAYLSLMREWPQHARTVSPDDLEAILDAGYEIRDAIGSVTATPGDRDATHLAPGTLLGNVLAYYQSRVADLTSEADVLARRHRQAGLVRVPPQTLLTRLSAADPDHPTLTVPQSLAVELPPTVRTAAVLALGNAQITYRLVSQDSIHRENVRRRWLIFGKRHDRHIYTRTMLVADLRFGELGTIATYWLDGPFVLSRSEEIDGDETSSRVVRTRELVPNPKAHFLTASWPRMSADPEAWGQSPPRSSAIALLESRIEDELRRYATAALDSVFRGACSLSGSTLDLDPADEESVLRIRNALEGLSAARFLLASYVRLALPVSSVSDAELEAALFGPDGLVDGARLCATVTAGESPLRRVWLEEEPLRTAARLEEALTVALTRQAGIREPTALVDTTLDEIETAIRLQRLRTLVARAGSSSAATR